MRQANARPPTPVVWPKYHLKLYLRRLPAADAVALLLTKPRLAFAVPACLIGLHRAAGLDVVPSAKEYAKKTRHACPKPSALYTQLAPNA